MAINYLLEDRRSSLMAQGRRGEKEKGTGKSRYEMRVNSKVANTTRQFNEIDMNSLFVHNILTINVPVVGETDNYTVRIKFGGFLDLLREQIERQNGEMNLRAVTRALLDAFNQDDVYIHCSCLHPSTRISLLDGTAPTVEEVYDRFSRGEELYCYSTNESGDVESSRITNVFITKRTFEFVEVSLDNGEVLLTTAEHLYRLIDGAYSRASDLSIGDCLMPSCITVTDIRKLILDKEVDVYDLSVEENHNFLTDAGVILHNCPDFKYRFNFWATMKDINSGVPEKRPAKITNPRNSMGPGCKHIMLVLSNNSWLIKVARVINNWVIYMSKNRKKQYADIVYPAIYGKPYEEPVQLSMDDETDLNRQSDIDTAIEQGRTRGQFTTGNKYRFQPRNTPRGQLSIDDVDADSEEQ